MRGTPSPSLRPAASCFGARHRPSNTAPLVDPSSGRVYVSSSNGFLSALNAVDGGVYWRIDLGAPILVTPALSADSQTIYSGTERMEAVALSAADGQIRWRAPLQGQSLSDRSPVVAGNLVMYRSQPLDYFHVLLQSQETGDGPRRRMVERVGWQCGTRIGPKSPQIRAHLNSNPSQQTFSCLMRAPASLIRLAARCFTPTGTMTPLPNLSPPPTASTYRIAPGMASNRFGHRARHHQLRC